jgi:hypothetical protein
MCTATGADHVTASTRTTNLERGSSVPACRRILYCPWLSSCRHSSSVCTTACVFRRMGVRV